MHEPELSEWNAMVKRITDKKQKTVEIVIAGKYFGTGDYQLRDSYAALFDAIDHAKWEVGVEVKTKWINTEHLEFANNSPEETQKKIGEIIGNPDGIIVPIGWGKRGAEGMIAAANYAREKKIPYLGLCYGMQLACVAFARNVIGWKDADTTENNPDTKHPVIHLIPSQKKLMKRRAYGGTMRLGAWEAKIKKGTCAYHVYKKYNGISDNGVISERHRHRYEFNDEFASEFEKRGLVISGRSVIEHLAEIIELPKDIHPFYFGIQGHPEYKSRPIKPHPVFLAFITATRDHS